jgi:imidazolonepropionase-like amidohydrolase
MAGVRILGEALGADVHVRDELDGRPGQPLVKVAGRPLKVPGGHGHDPVYSPTGLADPWGGIECVDEEQITQEVRRLCRDLRVDWIKLFVSGGISGAQETYRDTQMDLELIRAACLEADRWNVPVAAHAGNPEAVARSLAGGVASIEHGYELSDENVEHMAATGVWLVPTLSITHNTVRMRSAGWPSAMVEKARALQAMHADSFRRARAAGVRIACGSDMRPFGPASVEELLLLSELGLGFTEALAAGTLGSAHLCAADDAAGSIEVGKRADLLLLDSDPRDHIDVLRSPWHVLVSGAAPARSAPT